MQNSANPFPSSNRKQKRAVQFYNHLKESDPDKLHKKALTYRETIERRPLCQLVLVFWSQTQAKLSDRPFRHSTKPNSGKTKNYLTHLKESSKNQGKVECCSDLNREYSVAGYLTTVTDPKLLLNYVHCKF